MTNLEGQESIKGPFITCACLCEKVLQEKDGILSAVRIIDRMTINLIPNPAFSLPPGTFTRRVTGKLLIWPMKLSFF